MVITRYISKESQIAHAEIAESASSPIFEAHKTEQIKLQLIVEFDCETCQNVYWLTVKIRKSIWLMLRGPKFLSQVIFFPILLLFCATLLLFAEDWAGPWRTVFELSLLLVLAWIMVADFRRREIPDGANLLVTLIGAILWAEYPEALLWNAVVAVAVTLTSSVVGGMLWRRTGREWLGLGDAKLIGAGTMVVGSEALWIMVLLASIGGLCAALLSKAWDEEKGIPFGPFLAYAIFITYLMIR
jgi:prepilin signal peptidase PulO-like enzyme (type II secretory pathway)